MQIKFVVQHTAMINYSRPVIKKSLVEIAYPKICYMKYIMSNRMTGIVGSNLLGRNSSTFTDCDICRIHYVNLFQIDV